MARLRIGSLFSGIGGLELGLEVALGGEVVWQVERDEYCRSVLERHWPEAERYNDIKETDGHALRRVDLICGGFPCTEVSWSNNKWCPADKVGLEGDNSGLWSEYDRILGEVRPRIAVIENVPALARRGLVRVLGDLAAHGYDAEWHTLSAGLHCGAPHLRKRLFIIAYLPDALREGLEGYRHQPVRASEKHPTIGDSCWWTTEPAVGRMAHGVPGRVDKLKALGNAVVPQCAYLVGLRVRSLLEER